jgi:hypothetical protein
MVTLEQIAGTSAAFYLKVGDQNHFVGLDKFFDGLPPPSLHIFTEGGEWNDDDVPEIWGGATPSGPSPLVGGQKFHMAVERAGELVTLRINGVHEEQFANKPLVGAVTEVGFRPQDTKIKIYRLGLLIHDDTEIEKTGFFDNVIPDDATGLWTEVGVDASPKALATIGTHRLNVQASDEDEQLSAEGCDIEITVVDQELPETSCTRM